jgi:predicted transglutaminase-like cysteine proteinase
MLRGGIEEAFDNVRPALWLATAIVLLFIPLLAAEPVFRLDPAIIAAAENKFGGGAKERLLAWEKLVSDDASGTDLERLEKVNSFFNRIPFVSDAEHWLKKDYWATPIEFLASDGGDCEDFSLAKYFTLKLLGIPEEKLKLTYVKAWKINQAHMVVTYYPTPDAEPLVLDNLIDTIEFASERDDLLPVYSFNGVGLWLSKERGRGKHIGGSNRLSLWNDLLTRMPESHK